MSQSPLGPEEVAAEYRNGWLATWHLVRSGKSWSGYERDCCFLNLGDGRFADVSAVAGVDSPEDGRGLAVVDWDQDGALDFWITNRDAPRLRFFRNTKKASGASVALRLQGRSSNRDAIGARVELTTREHPDAPRVRIVAAGDGYLSQSSVWVHVGLGDDRAIEKVVVRWPGGEREEFAGVEAGRWRLIQGTGRAAPWVAPARSVALAPAPVSLPSASERRRIVVATSIPLPGLSYTAADGAARPVSTQGGKPLLLCLWASWCASCRQELSALEAHAAELHERGVRVLALSVDKPEDKEKARAVLSELGWSFETGDAPGELVGAIDAIFDVLLDRPGRMVLPTSLLLDRSGNLAVAYKGPVALDVLLADAARAPGQPEDPRSRAAAFPGRWVSAPHPAPLMTLAEAFSARGYTSVAEAYLARLSLHPDLAAQVPANQRARLLRAQLDLGSALAAEGRHADALRAYQRALELEPGSADGNLRLGIALRELGRLDEAERAFLETLRLAPSSARARAEMGLLHLGRGQAEAAEREFLAALELDPAEWTSCMNLGYIRVTQGRYAEAVEPLRQARSIRADDLQVRRMLGGALQHSGLVAESIAEYRAALAIDPRDPDVLFNLGLALADQGDLEGAQAQVALLAPLDAQRAQQLEARIAARGR